MTETFDDVLYEEGKQYKDDDKLVVAFYSRPVKNNFQSTLQGRPIFEDVDFVKIIIPGSRDVTDTKANDGYKARFPRQWAAYQNKKQTPLVGTPLSEVPWLGASVVAEFQACNVHTIEQLVGLSDQASSQFMGFSKIKERAQRFLDAAAGEAPAMKMEKQLEDLSRENTQLKEQLASLTGQVAALKDLMNTPKPIQTAAPLAKKV